MRSESYSTLIAGSRLPCRLFGQDQPAPAVDELPHRVEMAAMTGCFSHHMQYDFPQRVKSPVAEEFAGPPGWCGVQRSGGDDSVRAIDLTPVPIEDSSGRHIRTDMPSVG